MSIYSREITTPAASEQQTEVEVEGDYISYVNIRFPPGPSGLLGVAIFYGIHQIFPHDEGTWFAGDDETIAWQEYWLLPESPCTITIHTQNNDDTYEHSVQVRIATLTHAQSPAGQIGSAIVRAVKSALSFV